MFKLNEKYEVDRSIFRSDYIPYTRESFKIVVTPNVHFSLIYQEKIVSFF